MPLALSCSSGQGPRRHSDAISQTQSLHGLAGTLRHAPDDKQPGSRLQTGAGAAGCGHGGQHRPAPPGKAEALCGAQRARLVPCRRQRLLLLPIHHPCVHSRFYLPFIQWPQAPASTQFRVGLRTPLACSSGWKGQLTSPSFEPRDSRWCSHWRPLLPALGSPFPAPQTHQGPQQPQCGPQGHRPQSQPSYPSCAGRGAAWSRSLQGRGGRGGQGGPHRPSTAGGHPGLPCSPRSRSNVSTVLTKCGRE